jgi:hypothetical protein
MTARIVSAGEARGLLEGATPGPWRSSWDGLPDDDLPLIYSEAGPVCASMWYDGPHAACTEPDAALTAAAPDLAHTVIALECERDAALARVARLERVLAVEGGDESQAPEGWRPMSDGWVCRNGPVFDGRRSKCPRPDGREVIGSGPWWKAYHDKIVFSPSALEAMEAADAATSAPTPPAEPTAPR